MRLLLLLLPQPGSPQPVLPMLPIQAMFLSVVSLALGWLIGHPHGTASNPLIPHVFNNVEFANIGGASGLVGTQAVVRSAPDGYTFGVVVRVAIFTRVAPASFARRMTSRRRDVSGVFSKS